jgi:two-component system, OmpR family, response regulator
MLNILVVDDHENIRKLIAAYLERAGYQVFLATDGLDALDVFDRVHIDLMIVDVMMPNLDGLGLIRQLRDARFNLPILMITARENIDDKRLGFDAGTDDYMVKPIDFDEMNMRVAALLRRAKIVNEQKIIVGDVILDAETQSVLADGETIILPPKEFSLLFLLLSYPKKIFTRHDLMERIWGLDHDTDERTIDVHIKRLREKFDHLEAFKIITARGLGYKVEKYR